MEPTHFRREGLGVEHVVEDELGAVERDKAEDGRDRECADGGEERGAVAAEELPDGAQELEE
jgi:hypothetical protein